MQANQQRWLKLNFKHRSDFPDFVQNTLQLQQHTDKLVVMKVLVIDTKAAANSIRHINTILILNLFLLGLRGLWKGALPNIGRNAIVTVSEIVVYDIVKECLIFHKHMHDNVYCHFTAAVVAGKY